MTLLHLSGTPRQIGRAQGAAARAAGALDCVRFFAGFLDAVFRFQPSGSLNRLGRNIARRLVRETVERLFIDKIPKRYRETLEGFSEGSGLPLGDLQRAYVMPDVYAYLLGRKFNWPRKPPLPQVGFGCTAAVGASVRKTGRGLLHARNLDFPGGEAWTSFPAIIEYAPEDGQRYVSITSLAVPTAGVTAMNEAGLTLSLNMNYSRGVSTSGVPVVAIGHEVIRRAATLEEALQILNSFPKGAGWTLTLTSHRERNAVVAEFDAEGFSIRGLEKGHLVCTNHFLDPELAGREYWITPGRKIDSEARYLRSKELLAEDSIPTDPQRMAGILSDSHDPHLKRERAYGCTISQVHTVSSVLFEPEAGRIYVASGPPPVSKHSFVAYCCFPGPLQTDATIEGETHDAKTEARAIYAQAYELYFPKDNLLASEERLRRCTELDPTESLYWFMLGLVQMKRRNFERALHSLEEARKVPETGHRQAQFSLYHAHLLDLLGRREEAKAFYQTLGKNPIFGLPARGGVRRPWKSRNVRRLILDFMIGDAVDPGSG